MPPPNATSLYTPEDVYEHERLANLRPARWSNPTPAQRYQLAIIGAGPAGVAAAEAASALGASVALIERELVGGTCLNIGCVPSKAIIRTSRLYAEMRDAKRYGAEVPDGVRVDFAAVMERVRRIRARLSGRESVRRLAAAGVDVFFADASFAGADTLALGAQTLRFEKALIATGARPNIPTVPGLAEAGYLTNENIFDLTELPRRLLVVGGGPIGCELAQAFCRLGAKTTIVQNKPLFLDGEERDAAQILSTALAHDGIEVRLNTHVVAVRVQAGEKVVDLVSDDYRNSIAVDAILTGVGRLPNTEGLNLQAAGVACESGTGVLVDD
ncbi:MAG: FAD-dependent oxidoreductase, partial [Gammaproteobacteria bacterium]